MAAALPDRVASLAPDSFRRRLCGTSFVRGPRVVRLWRRRFLLAACWLLVTPVRAPAQQTGKVWRIGFLTTRSRPEGLERDFLSAWVPKLRELGYVDGKNLAIEWRFAGGDNDRLPALAADLVRQSPDLIITAGTPAALAAQKATASIPIVIAGVADPVGFGLVASLSRPGANITGASIMATDVSVKSLEFLRAFVPELSRVAVLLNPTNPIDPVALRQIQIAAEPRSVGVAAFEASTAGQIDAAFAAIASSRVEALIVAPDPLLVNQAHQIVDAVTRLRLPAIYPFRPFVEAGGLMCYGQDIYANFRVAATFVDRIFKGARPGELPVEQPTQLVLVVNRRAADAIGVKLPSSILARADEVL